MNKVIRHTLNKVKGNYDYFVLLQPTSPFRSSKDIDKALEILCKNKYKILVSISLLKKPINWLLNFNKSNKISFFYKTRSRVNTRQEGKKKYYPNFNL